MEEKQTNQDTNRSSENKSIANESVVPPSESISLETQETQESAPFADPPPVIQLPHKSLNTNASAPTKDLDANSELFSLTDAGGSESGSELQTVVTWGGHSGDQSLPKIQKFPIPIDRIENGEAHACAWRAGSRGLYIWGVNDCKQLGVDSTASSYEEGVHSVDRFKAEFVRDAACGLSHSAVILNSGTLVCFGSNEFGQCGVENQSELYLPPTDLDQLRYERFVKVACGDNYTLALTKTGKVYGFGNNDHCQLALPLEECYFKPTVVKALFGIPVVNLACGESHTLVLTAIGSVYSWGRNKYGELGLGHTRPDKKPQLISTLNGIRICEISCGAFHSAVVTGKRKMYLFGQNSYGQCGLGTFENVHRPTKILSERNIQSVSCGRAHTVCLADGDVFTFGGNDLGQCMYKGPNPSNINKPELLSLVNKQTDKIIKVVSGSFSCLAIVRRIEDEFAVETDNDSVETQFDESENRQLDSKSDDKKVVEEGTRTRLPRNEIYHLTFSGIASRCAISKASDDYGSLIHLVTKTFSSCSCVNASFLSTRDEDMLTFLSSGVELNLVRSSFENLLDLSVPELANRLSKAMHSLLEEAKSNLDTVEFPDALRFILILYEAPQWTDPGYSKNFLLNLNRIVIGIRGNLRKQLQRWFSLYEESMLLRLVHNLQERISSTIEGSLKVDGYVISIILVLELLYEANQDREKPIPYKEFENNTVSRSSAIDLNQHYLSWVSEKYGRGRNASGNEFSFCKYPFILDTYAKQEILKYEAVLQMQHEAQKAIQASFWFLPANPYFVLQVRREQLRSDTLMAINQIINTNPSVLKRPLKVVFVGEEGIDEGGVKKEFFQLIVRELFREEFGMFTYNSERRTFWFNQNSFESAAEFQLIGVILGLGIYNLTNLDVHFPQVVYKKLCKEIPSRIDLTEFDPVIANSMKELLEFKGDVENIFCLNFSVAVDYFGSTKIVELKKNGKDIPVTEENRREYVELYTKYLLVDSIETQFSPFAHGFHAVIDGPALSLLRPQELEMLVCGNTFLDFQALEAKTSYRGGFHSESRVIKWFWSVVHDMDVDSKKKLLKFATGTDRAPLRGLGHLPFIIQNAGANTDQLPTAHTCFNTLLIPNYNSYEELKKKLCIAIQNAEGFGLQ